MAQTLDPSLVASGKSGTVLISDINAITASLLSCHSGTSRPTYAVEGTIWYRTTDSKFLYYDGSTDVELLIHLGGIPPVKTDYTSGSGTHTTATGCKAMFWQVMGGGGGGGAAGCSSSSFSALAGAGGAGGRVEHYISSPAASYSYAVGAAGAGGASGAANNGSSGAASTLADGVSLTISAGGGSGGEGLLGTAGSLRALGGNGGTSSGGDINLSGGAGSNGQTVTALGVQKSIGGAGFFGQAVVFRPDVDNGVAAVDYGGGGSGAGVLLDNSYKAGGAGKGGLIRVWEYF